MLLELFLTYGTNEDHITTWTLWGPHTHGNDYSWQTYLRTSLHHISIFNCWNKTCLYAWQKTSLSPNEEIYFEFKYLIAASFACTSAFKHLESIQTNLALVHQGNPVQISAQSEQRCLCHQHLFNTKDALAFFCMAPGINGHQSGLKNGVALYTECLCLQGFVELNCCWIAKADRTQLWGENIVALATIK